LLAMGEGNVQTVQSPQSPGVFRRLLELVFMLVSAIMVLFMWDSTTRSRDENTSLRAELKKLKKEQGSWAVLFGVCLLLGSVILLFIWEYLTRAQEENSVLRGELRRLNNQKNKSDTSACAVCLENPREVVLTSCGHVCLCSDCAERIRYTDNRCPVCRKEIDKIRPAYIS